MFVRYYQDGVEDLDFVSYDWYFLEDTLFEAQFKVEQSENELLYFGDIYDEISHLYRYANLDYKENMTKLFLSEYEYRRDNCGIDIMETWFFKYSDIDFNKLVLLL